MPIPDSTPPVSEPALDPVAGLLVAVGVLATNFDQVLADCADSDAWREISAGLARAVDVLEYARDQVVRGSNRTGQITVRELATLVGRGKSRVGQIIQAGDQPSGTWVVLDADGSELGWVAGGTEAAAREFAEVRFDDRAAEVRSLSGHELAAAEIAAAADLVATTPLLDPSA
jgi:hypothetical protein